MEYTDDIDLTTPVKLTRFNRIVILSQSLEKVSDFYSFLLSATQTPILLSNDFNTLQLTDDDCVFFDMDSFDRTQTQNFLELCQIKHQGLSIGLLETEESDIIRNYLPFPVVKGVFKSDLSPELRLKGLILLEKGAFWFSRLHYRYSAEMRDGASCIKLEARYDLSAREMEIAVLLTQKESAKNIAEKLNISVNTVKSHKSSIYKKTGVTSMSQFRKLMLSLKGTND